MSIPIKYKESSNFYKNRNGYVPDIIVFHQTGGKTAGPAINTFMNPASKVSAHLLIDNSDIYQFVSFKDGAWCNNTRSVPGVAYYKDSTNRLVRERPHNANFYTYSIEVVMNGNGSLNAEQFKSCVAAAKHIIAEHKKIYKVPFIVDREHIIGHGEINPATRKYCPGEKFPFTSIISAINKKEEGPFVKGDVVKYKGIVYGSSYGEMPKGMRTGVGTIKAIYPGRFALYLIDGIGFFVDGALSK